MCWSLFYFLSFSDHKGSPFENKAIERTLSVEIAGTPGELTSLHLKI